MDHKKNAQRRQKRQSKGMECGSYWDCSVCTYRNTAEAFKCAMCDVRKGTSTRKPRLNPQLVAQQVAQQLNTTPSSKLSSRREESKERKPNNSSIAIGNIVHQKTPKKQKIRTIRPRLQNVDRTAVHEQPVTVNNVTVVITEFMPATQLTNTPQKKKSSSADVPISDLRTKTKAEKAEIVSVNGDAVAASTI